MRKIFKPFLMAATVAGLFFVSSCTKTCDEGYEGSDCKTEWRTKFIGTYQFADICPSGNYTGTAKISVSSNNVVTVLVENFAGIGSSATISGKLEEANKIVITSGAAAGFTITNATGTFNSDIINWTYTIASGGTETCTSKWTKQ